MAPGRLLRPDEPCGAPGRGWRRASRRDSRGLSGRAGSGAQGESASSTRRISWCPGPWLPSLVEPSGTDTDRHGRRF